MRLFVTMNAPREPLLLGMVAEIIWSDCIPSNAPSEANPTLGLRFESGHEEVANLSDCKFHHKQL